MTKFTELLMGYRAGRERAKSRKSKGLYELPAEIKKLSQRSGPWYSEEYTGPAACGFYVGLADASLERSLDLARKGDKVEWYIARDTFSQALGLYERYANVLESKHAQRKLTQYAKAGPFYWEKQVLSTISGAPGFGLVATLERLRGEGDSAAAKAYANLLDMIQIQNPRMRKGRKVERL